MGCAISQSKVKHEKLLPNCKIRKFPESERGVKIAWVKKSTSRPTTSSTQSSRSKEACIATPNRNNNGKKSEATALHERTESYEKDQKPILNQDHHHKGFACCSSKCRPQCRKRRPKSAGNTTRKLVNRPSSSTLHGNLAVTPIECRLVKPTRFNVTIGLPTQAKSVEETQLVRTEIGRPASPVPPYHDGIARPEIRRRSRKGKPRSRRTVGFKLWWMKFKQPRGPRCRRKPHRAPYQPSPLAAEEGVASIKRSLASAGVYVAKYQFRPTRRNNVSFTESQTSLLPISVN